MTPTERLPAANLERLSPDALYGRAAGVRRGLMEQAVAGRDVYCKLRTHTHADIGGWLGPRAVDVLALAEGLVFVAAGRLRFEGPNPIVVEVPYADVRFSTYNYTTSHLALAPGERCPVPALKVRPDQAQQLLAQIHHHKG